MCLSFWGLLYWISKSIPVTKATQLRLPKNVIVHHNFTYEIAVLDCESPIFRHTQTYGRFYIQNPLKCS